MNNKEKKSGWGKFVLGAMLGGALGVLFAPKKGSETRKELRIKANELIEKAKEIDIVEVKDNILNKAYDIIDEVQSLDSEKVKDIALEKIDVLKYKCEDLVEFTKAKATPTIQKAAEELRAKAILVTKDVLKKLEDK